MNNKILICYFVKNVYKIYKNIGNNINLEMYLYYKETDVEGKIFIKKRKLCYPMNYQL